MGESRKPEYSCTACGAKLQYSPGSQSLQCPYCGAKVDIATGEKTPSAGDSKYVVPLSVDRQQLQNAAYRYMFSQEDAPDDILDYATFTKTKLRYVPCYVYQGSYDAVWTASFGYDRTESYMVNGKVRTRTVTDWRPANGRDFGDFAVMSYAGEPLPGQVVGMLEASSGPENMKPYDPAYLINSDVSEFAATAEEIYQRDGESKVNAVIEQNIYKHAQGDRQRDWRWKSNVQKESIPVLVPIGQMTFEYKGKEYTVWCDGTDEGVFTGDELPVDTTRSKKLMLGHIPWVGTVVGAIAGYFLFSETYTWWAFVVPIVVMLLYWFLRRSSIRGYSRQLKQRSLTNFQISNNISNEDAETISKNLKAPEKPLLLSLTAFDMIILPALPIACFAISCGLQQAFPTKHTPSAPVKRVKTVAQGSPSVIRKDSETLFAKQNATTTQSLEAAQQKNKAANSRFTNIWRQIPADKRQSLAQQVKGIGKQINETCKQEALQGTDATGQKMLYLNCTTQKLNQLSNELQKFTQ
ncbi:MAG: hypothetical protein J5492_05895 [Oxalobacter sp.]|jgi:DNA-directed RNA polymerase subunit RPC12/RpoP|nr:hypothetical protein [Oxalobacter sp.]